MIDLLTYDSLSSKKTDIGLIQKVLAAIRERCLAKKADGLLLSPSGKTQDWLIDLRPLLLDAGMLTHVADLFLQKLAKRDPYQIAGMEVAAIPLLTAIALRSDQSGATINSCIIRKERKTYGLGRLIEGH